MNLTQYEAKKFSQHGEAGIIAELVKRLDPPRIFVEIGVETGHECNCRFLADLTWRGMFVEARSDCWLELVKLNHERLSRIHCVNERVTIENVRSVLAPMPREMGVLSIDVDGFDYHLLRTVLVNGYRPWIIVIEVNQHQDGEYIMDYNPEHNWDGESLEYGASFESMSELCKRNGYAALGTDSTGVNAFYVRDDKAGLCE